MSSHAPALSVTRLTRKTMPDEKTAKRDPHHFIYLFKEASGTHTIGERIIPLQNGTIHFVAQGLPQSFSGVKKLNGFCIGFSPDLFSRFTLNKEILYDMPFLGYDVESPAYPIPAEHFGFLYSLFSFMHHEASEKNQGYERIIISTINIILLKCGHWFRLSNRKKNEAHYVAGYYGSLQLVESYKKLIRENFKKERFVKFYAQKLNQTPNYLNVVVRSVTGLKASDLIHAQIISEAKHLLIHTKLSHKEVAAELGFTDQSYFTKFFRRETGQRPLEWFRSNK